jgi:hypothetical protein
MLTSRVSQLEHHLTESRQEALNADSNEGAKDAIQDYHTVNIDDFSR